MSQDLANKGRNFSMCFCFAQDEDWENLSKKLGIQDDEMSLAQFIQLHLLEAKNGESVELWMALWTMGYNHTLKPDESFNFKVRFPFFPIFQNFF